MVMIRVIACSIWILSISHCQAHRKKQAMSSHLLNHPCSYGGSTTGDFTMWADVFCCTTQLQDKIAVVTRSYNYRMGLGRGQGAFWSALHVAKIIVILCVYVCLRYYDVRVSRSLVNRPQNTLIIVTPICSALHTMYIYHIIVATCKQVAQQTN